MIRARAEIIGAADVVRIVTERVGEADVATLQGTTAQKRIGGCDGAARVDVSWRLEDCAVVSVVAA